MSRSSLVTEADELPDSPNAVTYSMVDRDEDGKATDVEDDVIDEDTDTFAVTVEAGNRDTPLTIVDLNGVIEDDDDLKFAEEGDDGDASHLVLEANGILLLTYVPPGADADGGRTNWLKVSATDEFNDTEVVSGEIEPKLDQTFYIAVTVIEKITPIQSEFVGITVPENTTDCSLTDGGGACSLAGVLDLADSYTIESGVDIVMDDAATADVDESDFSVDGSGTITVNNKPDFEAGLRPAFIVRVDDANGDLLGLISVRVTIVDENEDPVINELPAGDVAWVYENFQVGDAVVTKVSTQASPDAESDPDTLITATDPEGGAVSYSIDPADKAPFSISSDGTLRVADVLNAEDPDLGQGEHVTHTFTVIASDPQGNTDEYDVTVVVLNSNETPNFTSPEGEGAVKDISESVLD